MASRSRSGSLTMSLPAFLRPSSPPRSPHTAPPSFIHTYFPASDSPTRKETGILSIRPTRRDVLLCLLTLSFSYLLFTPPGTAGTASYTPKPAPNRWSSLFSGGSTTGSQCTTTGSQEVTFGESVRTYGPNAGIDTIKSGPVWDGGEEEAEDDGLAGVQTVLLGHAPGWTLMDRVYIYNGSFYIITLVLFPSLPYSLPAPPS